MIRKNTYGLSPTLNIAISGAAVDYMALNKIEVLLEENKHDMAIISMAGLPPRAITEYRNRPVQITIDNGGNYIQEFVGYVVDVRPESRTDGGLLNGSPFQDVSIICMGASYNMRGAKSKSWVDHTLTDVVSELSPIYGFSADVPNEPLVFTPLIQDGESDWQFVVRYAKDLGYSVTYHGTHLHVFDPHAATSRRISYNRLLTTKNVTAAKAAHPGQIIEFKASLAEHHPDGVFMDTVVSVQLDDTNEIFDVSLRELRGLTKPARFTDRLPMVVDTYEQATRAIRMRHKEKYDFHATAKVMGLAGCKPGGLVSVDSYGSEELDGFWYVQAVKHVLASGAFFSDLVLARNITNEYEIRPPVAALKRPSAPKLVNNQWVTLKRGVRVYS